MMEKENKQIHNNRVGLLGLVMIVVGSMLGGGVFNLPGEIAATSGVIAAMVAWAITGLGVFCLAKVFQTLSNEEPQITGGIYYYARTGFGRYVGFNSAWGYWLSNVIGNVSFIILFVDALTKFFPKIGGSSSIIGLIIGSIMIWAVVVIVARGVKTASLLNNIATIAKIIPVVVGVVILIINFKYHLFSADVFAHNIIIDGHGIGSVATQVKNAMLQTMWVFIGVEGAVVISDRAKHTRDVGKATMMGFLSVLLLYVLVVVLSYGILPQEQIANLPDPSLGGVLRYAAGDWAADMIDIGVIISVLGAWISWAILTAEIPFMAARDETFPKFMGKENNQEAPISALVVNGAIMQVVYIISMFASNAFQAVTDNATTMVLVPYLLSGAFLWKVAHKRHELKNECFAIGSMIYGFYMMYSSGLQGVLFCVVLYALGFAFWLWNHKEYHHPLFENNFEKYLFYILCIAGIFSLCYLIFIK